MLAIVRAEPRFTDVVIAAARNRRIMGESGGSITLVEGSLAVREEMSVFCGVFSRGCKLFLIWGLRENVVRVFFFLNGRGAGNICISVRDEKMM